MTILNPRLRLPDLAKNSPEREMHLVGKRIIAFLVAGAVGLLASSFARAQPDTERVEISCSAAVGQKLQNLGRFAVAAPSGADLKKNHADDSSVWSWKSKALQLRIELGELGSHQSDGAGFCADKAIGMVSARRSVERGWINLVRDVVSDDGLSDVRITVRAHPAFLQKALAALASFQLAPDAQHLKLLAISSDARYAVVEFEGVPPIRVHVGDQVSANWGTLQDIDAEGINVEEYKPDGLTGAWDTKDVRISLSGATVAGDRMTYPDHGLVRCADLVSVKPGQGRSFGGHLSGTGDYPFSVTIPPGLVSWDGVADSAPFHGFTIFLNESLESCIDFEIHVRVDETEGFRHPPVVTGSVKLGKVRGFQSDRAGDRSGTSMVNHSTVFSAPMDTDSFADGEVLLIAPKADEQAALSVYNQFLQSLKFR